MLGPRIHRWEQGPVLVSAILASDTGMYEVGVAHPWYKNGNIIVVFASEKQDDVTRAFDKWVAIFSDGDLPDFIEAPPTSWLSAYLTLSNGGPIRYQKEAGMGIG